MRSKLQPSFRSIPVVWNEKEHKFMQVFVDFLAKIGQNEALFPLSRQRIGQILAKIGLFPHFLRHLRASHNVIDYEFDSEYLKQFFGWSSSKTAENYVHLNIKNLVDKMRKNN